MKKLKIIYNILCILAFLTCLFLAEKYFSLNKENARLYSELIGAQTQYKNVTESLAQLKIDYKNQKDLLTLQKEKFDITIRDKDERIKSLSEEIFTHKNQVIKVKGHGLVYVPKIEGRPGYYFNEVRLEGEDSPPIGWVMISEDGYVRTGAYKFDLVVEQLQTKNEESGKVKVYSQAYLVSKQDGLANRKDKDLKKWKGIKYPLQIIGGVAFVDPTEKNERANKRFYFNAPRFSLGVLAGANQSKFYLNPSINVSLAGHGYSKRDLNFRFLEIGIGFSTSLKNPSINMKPILWRPFKNTLPNTYLAPALVYNFDTGLGGALSLSLTF